MMRIGACYSTHDLFALFRCKRLVGHDWHDIAHFSAECYRQRLRIDPETRAMIAYLQLLWVEVDGLLV